MGSVVSDIFGGGSNSVNVPAPAQINIPQILQLAQTQAANNISQSQALQQQYAPQLAAATGEYQSNLNQLLGQYPGLQNLVNSVGGTVANAANGYTPPTLSVPQYGANPVQAQVNAITLQNLQNPGALPQDVQNAASRAAAQSAGQGGFLGSTAAGNLNAADLGLTSYGVMQNNLAQGNQVGAQNQSLNLAQQALGAQTQQAQAQLGLQGIASQQAGASTLNSLLAPYLTAMGAVGSTPLPVSGLSPTDIANLSVANTNATNAYNQQTAATAAQQANANNSFLGNLFGTALGAFAAPAGGTSAASGLLSFL